MTRKLMPWPDLLGARDTLDRIVVGRKRSQSKWSNTRFVVYNPRCKVPAGATATITAGHAQWANDAPNIAILAEGLREVVNRKVEVPFTRGQVAMQMTETTLVMYEVYRGILWPRYWWPMHLSAPPYPWAINQAILMETLRPDHLVAFADSRDPIEMAPSLPHVRGWDKPRWTGDTDDYIDQILALHPEDT